MTNDRLRLLADELWDYSRKLGEKKGAEYAHMDNQEDDRFRNFRLAAQVAMMENPGQSVMNYLMKSFMSIGRYVARNCAASMNEPVKDRFADLINYTVMLYGWVVEQEEANEQRAYHGDGGEVADPFSIVEYSGREPKPGLDRGRVGPIDNVVEHRSPAAPYPPVWISTRPDVELQHWGPVDRSCLAPSPSDRFDRWAVYEPGEFFVHNGEWFRVVLDPYAESASSGEKRGDQLSPTQAAAERKANEILQAERDARKVALNRHIEDNL